MNSEQKLAHFGFRFGQNGVHSARTMMLSELDQLIDHCSASAAKAELQAAVVEHNILAKPSLKARQLTWRHLSDLYSFNTDLAIWRAFISLWATDAQARPLLALTMALARDTLLRASQNYILPLAIGSTLRRETVEEWMEALYPNRFSAASKRSFAQNLNGSWTNAGYLTGRQAKVRSKPLVKPANIAFCLFLGHLEGLSGQRLFSSSWMQLLPGTVDEHTELCHQAAHKGLLVFMNAGGVMEVRFPEYLTFQEEALRNE